ncbi:MAG: sodium/solute symporter [Verrucomicrobium sp.]|nr:sodium/solute symporter [Verrucomicrobium sp.]
MVAIGLYISRKVKTSEDYFLAKRSLPGWLVGISIFATTISCLSFTAIPAFTFKHDYLWVSSSCVYIFVAVFAMYFIMPFFRKVQTPSGYEYLERRFGTWARVYLALGYVVMNSFRMGIILYAIALTFETATGIRLPWIVVVLGVTAAVYAISGGLEAVIWTDLFQSGILLVGAVVCIGAALHGVPGGFSHVAATAYHGGKMSLGSMDLSLTERTFWTIVITSIFSMSSASTTAQDAIQRYRAPESEKEARIALGVSAFTMVPVWLLFSFLGTVLWAFYQAFPDPHVQAMAQANPEKIVPYFIFTQLPSGLGGIVLAGMLMASVSAINGSLNACAATATSDFYERFIAPGRPPRHYLSAGRWISCLFGAGMIGMALLVYWFRQSTLQDLQALMIMIITAGSFGLFMIGFLSRRVDNFSAAWATGLTVAGVSLWVFLQSDWARLRWPGLSPYLPNLFWLSVFSNVSLFALAWLIARLFNRRCRHSLTDLTIFTLRKEDAGH